MKVCIQLSLTTISVDHPSDSDIQEKQQSRIRMLQQILSASGSAIFQVKDGKTYEQQQEARYGQYTHRHLKKQEPINLTTLPQHLILARFLLFTMTQRMTQEWRSDQGVFCIQAILRPFYAAYFMLRSSHKPIVSGKTV